MRIVGVGRRHRIRIARPATFMQTLVHDLTVPWLSGSTEGGSTIVVVRTVRGPLKKWRPPTVKQVASCFICPATIILPRAAGFSPRDVTNASVRDLNSPDRAS